MFCSLGLLAKTTHISDETSVCYKDNKLTISKNECILIVSNGKSQPWPNNPIFIVYSQQPTAHLHQLIISLTRFRIQILVKLESGKTQTEKKKRKVIGNGEGFTSA